MGSRACERETSRKRTKKPPTPAADSLRTTNPPLFWSACYGLLASGLVLSESLGGDCYTRYCRPCEAEHRPHVSTLVALLTVLNVPRVAVESYSFGSQRDNITNRLNFQARKRSRIRVKIPHDHSLWMRRRNRVDSRGKIVRAAEYLGRRPTKRPSRGTR